MKKLFVIALAAIGMVACVQNEIVEAPKSDAIAFAGAYIDNATRAAVDPSFTTDQENALAAFNVWGYMDQTAGTVFAAEDVQKVNGAWSYANTQYWAPEHDYYFAALAPMDSANIQNLVLATDPDAQKGLGSFKFVNVAGGEDLIYAEAKVTTPGMNAILQNGMDPVQLQFNHLLSKVKFTFKNGFTTNNAYVEVKNIKMTVANNATIDLATDAPAWANLAGKTELAFGNVANLAMGQSDECTDERLTIPATDAYTYDIEFTVVVYMGTVKALEVTKTSTVTGQAFEMGKAYNLVAEITPDNLNLLPIEFDVVVKEWETPYVDVEVDSYFDPITNTYTVANADGLQTVLEGVATGETPADANIVLGGDIDLNDVVLSRAAVKSNWVPVGTSEKPFTGTFDGNGYTIKNLSIVENEAKEGKAHIGFFGYAKDATIKNVTFENVYLNIPCLDIDHSQGHIGAVAGTLEGTSTIENVTVKGLIQIEATPSANGASRVAVVVGGNSYANVTIKNVHVVASEGSYLKANNNTGAIAGQLQGKTLYENCSSNIDVTVNKFFAGGIVGLAGTNDTFINCHTTGNVAVVAGREGRANDHYRVGGIAGGWADGKTNVLTLTNCSYTGTLTGINADGSVADKFDYAGYVGRGYTLANCEGSKVVIDGTEYVQVGNGAPYGNYTINGCTPVYTADELVATLAAGKGVMLMNDITVAATTGGYKKAGIIQNKAQTIDGGGHTLTVTGAGETWSCAIYTNGGIIRNLTVKGAMRGIFTAGQSSDLYIENVEFKNVIYTFNSDGDMPANPFGVYVSNSAVNGWTSHSNMHTEVVYTNCSFGEGSGYKYGRPYGKTSYVNCTFCAGYTLDKSMTNDITLTDCVFE